jgi:hypothetical protein
MQQKIQTKKLCKTALMPLWKTGRLHYLYINRYIHETCK